MRNLDSPTIDVLIVAVPESTGSTLYGLVDVLSAAGRLWQELVRQPSRLPGFRVHIVSPGGEPMDCGNGIPVHPHFSIADEPGSRIVILPELWLGPDESIRGRYPALMNWLRHCHGEGREIYSACSGALLLAESGLLDGCSATSHWGYRELFERDYPAVDFRPEPNLVVADEAGRIVTAGGTTSWHDLALHIIARHVSPAEAARIARVYLLKWHGEGQLPYTPLVKRTLHADTVVRRSEEWLAGNFSDGRAIAKVVAMSGLPERTFKRRFRNATGAPLKDYLQNLRIEEAKRLLESCRSPIEEISWASGYEDVSFFRRLFKRLTGVTPAAYRRLFPQQPESRAETIEPG